MVSIQVDISLKLKIFFLKEFINKKNFDHKNLFLI